MQYLQSGMISSKEKIVEIFKVWLGFWNLKEDDCAELWLNAKVNFSINGEIYRIGPIGTYFYW